MGSWFAGELFKCTWERNAWGVDRTGCATSVEPKFWITLPRPRSGYRGSGCRSLASNNKCKSYGKCEKWASPPTSTQDGGDKDTLRLGGDGMKTQPTANLDLQGKCRFIYSALKYVIQHSVKQKKKSLLSTSFCIQPLSKLTLSRLSLEAEKPAL